MDNAIVTIHCSIGHSKGKITIPTVYVDDIIIILDDGEEITRLKRCLKVFEFRI